MLILSIDVGIKNLAFCLCKKIINIEDNKINIEIIDWSIINLINNNLCTAIKSCKCNAKYFVNDNDIVYYFCNKHAEKSKYNIDKLTKFKSNNSNNISLIEIGENIIKYLDAYFNNLKNKNNILLENINFILIENQIGPLANRMKSLQAMISMYFLFNKNNSIYYINSSNKLKNFIKKSTSYKERKKLGIKITDDLISNTDAKININNNNYWKTFFTNSSKKDDLADCFLQLIYFINN